MLTPVTEEVPETCSRARYQRRTPVTGCIDGPVRTFEATSVRGESTHAAYLDAEAWLVKRRERASPNVVTGSTE